MASEVVDFIMWAGEQWDGRLPDPEASALTPRCALEDPELLPGDVPLHGFVWRLLAQGGEHFAAHHAWMRATDWGVRLRPSMSLGRTAAVAAVRALYVMGGKNGEDRRARVLQLMNDEAEGLESIAKIARPREGVTSAELRAEAEAYRSAIGEELKALGRSPRSSKSDTELMAGTAPAFLENHAKALEQLDMFWRHASGAVHARAYTWDTGLERMSAADQLTAAWSMPAQLLEMAWDRWNRMRGADVEGRLPA